MKFLLSSALVAATFTSLQAVDLDDNGLSDLEDALIAANLPIPGGGGGVAGVDTDSDSYDDLSEQIVGTDPNDGSSFPNIKGVAMNSAGTSAVVTWDSVSDVTYTLQTSADLESWNSYGAQSGTGGELQQLVNATANGLVPSATNPAVQLFFRLKIDGSTSADPGTDSDNDGVTDWEEDLLGWDTSDPNSVRSAGGGGDYQQLVDLLTGASPNGGLPNSTTAGVPSETLASRFLAQATFGPSTHNITELRSLGVNAYEKWIDDQIASPTITSHEEYIDQIKALSFVLSNDDQDTITWNINQTPGIIPDNNVATAWMQAAMRGEDELRQRVAWELFKIMPVGRASGGLTNASEAQASYYDTFVENAFGSFNDLLYTVSTHATMGSYLNHLGNTKANPAQNQLPDENYAREIMQLFSIGLWELNPDGSRALDGSGQPIPTYSNADITELARVFTGQWYDSLAWGDSGNAQQRRGDLALPMVFHPFYHDTGAKTALNGLITIPAGLAGNQEIEMVCDALASHPTCAPFISLRLIQGLVTSNPSPAYLARVSTVFANSNGNLGDTVKAILLDEEARSPRFLVDETFGKMRAPLMRITQLGRAFDAGLGYGPQDVTDRTQAIQWWTPNGTNMQPLLLQWIFHTPSVFSFFAPEYSAPGEVADRNLYSPEMKLQTAAASINTIIELHELGMERDFHTNTDGPPAPFVADLSSIENSLSDFPTVVDHLNLLLCSGTMRSSTRAEITARHNEYHTPTRSVLWLRRLPVSIAITAPESAVLR